MAQGFGERMKMLRLAEDVLEAMKKSVEENCEKSDKERNLKEFDSLLKETSGEKHFSESAGYVLHHAAYHNLPAWGERLLKHGAKVNYQEPEKEDTPLHRAVENGNLEMVDLLIKYGADINIQNKEGTAPIHVAVSRHGLSGCLQSLISSGADLQLIETSSELSPLGKALDEWVVQPHPTNNLQQVRMLLQSGCDITKVEKEPGDATAFSFILTEMSRGQLEVDAAYKLVELLLEHGMDPDATDAEFFTLLYYSTLGLDDYFPLVRLLLNYGADPLINTSLRAPKYEWIVVALLDCTSDQVSDNADMRDFGPARRMLTLLLDGVDRFRWSEEMEKKLEGMKEEFFSENVEEDGEMTESKDALVKLCDWLRSVGQNPRELKHLGRCQVRKSLGRNGIFKGVRGLNLQEDISSYLLIKS
ncbi:ASB6 [Branchiostoma lanceolatum]|uniref:ASB6 protein n=1 Tax=Branchiostoma lanceolatum TaxID=7740 RepID=A0A8J9Z1Z2_BRALA|nr:ASB6 [Branchiostoma lanceolatum]